MANFFNIIPEVPTDARLWQSVAELGWLQRIETRESTAPPPGIPN